MRRNSRYLNGEATEEEILNKFLNNFETTGTKDGMVRANLLVWLTTLISYFNNVRGILYILVYLITVNIRYLLLTLYQEQTRIQRWKSKLR